MSKIFIGHSSADNAAAAAMARWLDANGWADHFLDISETRGLMPGQRWQAALRAGADRCQAVLFLISPAWLDSKWCLAEFLLAKMLGKKIFGVLVKQVSHASLPIELAGEFQLCDLVAGDERTSFDISIDGIVAASVVSFGAAGLAKLRRGLSAAGLDPTTFAWPPPEDPERLPYRGLRALESPDAAVFFGRGAELVRGLDGLRAMRDGGTERLLVLLGASGAGKSSFLRAGLLPRLARDDVRFLTLPPVRPEDAALSGAHGLVASLERACRQLGIPSSRGELKRRLDDASGLRALVTELRQAARRGSALDAPAPTVIVPIDQGEELFDASGRREAEAFLSLLQSALADPPSAGDGPPAIAVVAIRAESYVQLQTEPLLESLRTRLFPLNPIGKAEFKSVIDGPAAVASGAGHGVALEPDLVERLLHDAEGPDALPLLAFTLERLLVEYGGSGRLQAADYAALGGIRGAIEAAIQQAFEVPDREPAVPRDPLQRETLLRRAFVPWLATVDPHSGERQRRIARWDDMPAETRPLIERLVEARVLLRDVRDVRGAAEGSARQTVVEIAHEALLRQWSALQSWLDESADELQRIEACRRAAAEWARNGESAAWLVHTGERLAAVKGLLGRAQLDRLLGDAGHSYLRACDEQESRRREREADIARSMQALASDALRAQSRFLANASMIELARGDTGLAVRLALAAAPQHAASGDAADRPAVPEAWVALHRATEANRERLVLRGHRGEISALAFSPDGSLLLTASWDGRARLWNAATGALRCELAGHTARVESAVFSADGRLVATGSRHDARVWRADTGEAVATLASTAERALFTRADGSELVTCAHIGQGPIVVWDVASGQPLHTLALDESVGDVSVACLQAITYSRELAPPPYSLSVWDLRTGLHTQLSHPAWRDEPWWNHPTVRLSPRGDVMAVSFNHTSRPPSRLLRISDGKPLASLGDRDLLVGSAFSPDGRLLLIGGEPAQLWDVAAGGVAVTLQGAGDVFRASFSDDGERLVTWSRDDQNGHTVRVWDPQSGRAVAALPARRDEGVVAAIPAVRSADERCLTGGSDGTVRVWDVRASAAFAFGDGLPQRCAATVDTDRGEIVAVHADASVHVFDRAAGHPLRRFTTGCRYVTATVCLPARRRIALMEREGLVCIHDLESGHEVAALPHAGEALASLAFAGDGTQLVTTDERGDVRLWDVASGRCVRAFHGHSKSVALHFSADGRRMLTSSPDGLVHTWDLASGACLRTLSFRSARIGVSMGPASATGVSAVGDAVLVLDVDARGAAAGILRKGDVVLRWNDMPADHGWLESRDRARSAFVSDFGLRDGEPVRIVFLREGARQEVLLTARDTGPDAYLTLGDVDPDLRRVVLTGDQYAELWDLDEGRRVACFGHDAYLSDAALAPDGTRVVTTTASGQQVTVWDVQSGKAVATHLGPTLCIAFCPDGTRFVTAQGAVAALYALDSGEPLSAYAPAVEQNPLGGTVAVSPDGTQVVVLPAQGPAYAWPLLPAGDALLAAARQQVPQPLTNAERARFFMSPR